MKIRVKVITVLIILILGVILAGCGSNSSSNNTVKKTADTISNKPSTASELKVKSGTPVAFINIKDYGIIAVELRPDMAPNTVNNFIELASKNFYKGLTFHRVVPGFVIQGGDPKGDGTGGPGYSIKGEFKENNFPQNTLSHDLGVISMARAAGPDTGGSQFFLVSGNKPDVKSSLDGKYAGFGTTLDGLEIIDKIQNVAADASGKPNKDVVIDNITIDLNGYKPAETVKN